MHYFSFLVQLDTKRTNENAMPKFTENPTQFAFEKEKVEKEMAQNRYQAPKEVLFKCSP